MSDDEDEKEVAEMFYKESMKNISRKKEKFMRDED
jgi:hypothetical protein